MPSISILLLSAALAGVGWIAPFAGATFVVAGAIPLYALLHVLEISPTGPIAGPTLASVGIGSLIRLLISRDRPIDGKGRLSMALLFGAFVAFWYLRWFQDPPDPSLGGSDFGSKAVVFMVFLAIVPFLSGLLMRGPEDVRALLVWLARWGVAGLLIVGAYWITGQPSRSPHPNEVWEPIPSLSIVFQSFDLGIGALASVIVLQSRNELPWRVMKGLLVIAAGGLMIFIGQRGPFVFFAIALLIRALLASRGLQLRRLIAVIAVIGVVGVSIMAASGDENRTLSLSNYTVAGNANRLFLFQMAARHFQQRPLVGWGGGMVGKQVALQPPFDPHPWDYVHNVMLDPLLETGIIGASVFWALFAILFLRTVRGLRKDGPVAAEVRALLPLLAYVFAESQVSGHVCAAKHFWMLTGLLIAVLARMSQQPSVDQTNSGLETHIAKLNLT